MTMSRISILSIIALAITGCSFTPPPIHPPASLRAPDSIRDTMFPKSTMMTLGVYYYPTAWPESQWARDIENIKKLNLEFVHMGEFDWAFLEPEEGKFDFA